MKTNQIIFVLFISIIGFFAACDIVEEPYKKNTSNPGDTTPDTIPTVLQKVLLEDYTGHDCVNCPTAAEEAHEIQKDYEDQLIIIAVHAGWFARPIPQEPALAADYTCPAGETWYDFFQAVANPIGMVNRVQTSGTYLVNWQEWGNAIAQEAVKEPQAEMSIENSFNESTSKLTTTINTKFLAEQNDQFNILVVVTQDSIIGGQKNNDEEVGEVPLIEDYVFMHMLRGSLNGDWGEQLTEDNPILMDAEYSKTYTYTFPDEWIPKDCHVVSFVYNSEDLSVLQVEEASVLQE